MQFDLSQLILEVTRRCGLKCGHCLRGDEQEIDMSFEMIDKILDDPSIKSISKLFFTGGEPTLNSKVIIYAINKIIDQQLDVSTIGMITNGQSFDLELIDAFNRFNQYRNEKNRELVLSYSDRYTEDELEREIEQFTDNHVLISFSVDSFHKKVPQEVRDNYALYSKGLSINNKITLKKDIIKTGNATFGREYTYELRRMNYTYPYGMLWGESYCMVWDSLYVSAKGNYASCGDGSYEDMDRINMGSIYDVTLFDLLSKWGYPITEMIALDEDVKQLRMEIKEEF